MTSGSRKPGEFCWINVLTPQANEARTFFSKLLGWKYVDMPGMSILQVDGHNFGALLDLADPNTPKGKPARIGVLVKVENAEATSQKVKKLGGKSEAVTDVKDGGRMAVCTDPSGAEFGLWEPKKLDGTDIDSDLNGAPSWFENLTTDVDRAGSFYSELFGWTPEPLPGTEMPYTVFRRGTTGLAGMLQITPQMGKMPPQWATYFTVKDADAALRDAVKLGATICMPPKEVKTVGRFGGITSPQGVTFYVIHYER